MRSIRNQTRNRKGWLSMELAMTLPILMILLLGAFEFTLLFFARGEVVEASKIGARKATYSGVSQEEVQEEVLKVLNPRYHQYAQIETVTSNKSGEVVSVIVRVPMQLASPDLLWPVGFGLAGKELISETRMIKE